MTLSIQTDRTLIRAAASSTRYVLARITAPRAPARETRIPVNVGIVVDRSGSMGDERKFGLARKAVEQSLRMLRPEDRFALVVYDTEVDVLMPSMKATPEVKRRALEALREIGPRGGTDLGAGWLRGCEQLAEFTYDDQVSRCLLLTDGLANHGITDRDELARHAGELRRQRRSGSVRGAGIRVMYAKHQDNDVQPRDREVDRAVAAVYAARAREEATEANRDQRYEDARRVLEATARRILGYAGSDARLRHIAEDLVRVVHEYERPMAVMARKASLYAANSALKGRDELGRARR